MWGAGEKTSAVPSRHLDLRATESSGLGQGGSKGFGVFSLYKIDPSLVTDTAVCDPKTQPSPKGQTTAATSAAFVSTKGPSWPSATGINIWDP